MNYNKKSIEDIDVAGKRVLCRCDFNVPTKNGVITSDKRIVAAMPTIKYLVDHNAKVILCSHMGKPKGEWKPELSLKIVAKRISELLGKEVIMAADVAGEDAKAKAAALKDGDVMLLEKVDTLIIGGGMAYTFLKAQGYEIGKSLCDDSKLDYCKDMMAKAEAKGVKLLLPVDVVVADSFPDPIDGPIDVTTVDAAAIPADKEGLDIGEKTCALFASAVKDAKTVVWNGPMGVFENPTLAKGTIAMAQALADSSATTIVGGGDSAAACEQLGFADKITHISTGGGASLEFLEGLELPGIACLEDK